MPSMSLRVAARSLKEQAKIMNLHNFRRVAPLALCALALAGATAARADIQWTVTGTFDDGATLSGYFDVNMYDQFSDFDLKTSGGSVVGSQEYKFGADGLSSWSQPDFVEFQPFYQADLHLGFALDLGAVAATNEILISGPTPGPSFECIDSFNCDTYQGPTHFLTSGSATGLVIPDINDGGNGSGSDTGAGNGVPEPASWALMIAGFGMAGGMLRSSRRRSACA
jgi:PEP-CTERM motif